MMQKNKFYKGMVRRWEGLWQKALRNDSIALKSHAFTEQQREPILKRIRDSRNLHLDEANACLWLLGKMSVSRLKDAPMLHNMKLSSRIIKKDIEEEINKQQLRFRNAEEEHWDEYEGRVRPDTF